MIDLYAAALEVQEFLKSKNWRFCIIGAVALARWGQPRATSDVDLSLFVELGSEEEYIDALLERFSTRISDARSFALANRVLLLEATNGVPIDIALASFPFEEAIIGRATSFEFTEDVELLTASAEDLLVLKAFAGRPQDWVDVESIAVRQSQQLDWDYVFRRLEELHELAEDSDVLERVEDIRRRSETL